MTDLVAPHLASHPVARVADATAAARRPRPAVGAHANNPVRIERIGTDHVQVFIRPARGDAELRLGVERLEQLFDSGFDTIDVVFEPSSRPASDPDRPADTDGAHTHRPDRPDNPTRGDETR